MTHYPRTTLIMLRLATHTHDVPVFSGPAFSVPTSSVAPFALLVRRQTELLAASSIQMFVITAYSGDVRQVT